MPVPTGQGLTVSDELGARLVLTRANKDRLWRPSARDPIYDEGRPLVPWLQPHLDAVIAAGQIQLVTMVSDGWISQRAVLTPPGALRLHELSIQTLRRTPQPQPRPEQKEPSREQKGRLMWPQWLTIALLAALIAIRVIVNHHNRPSGPTDRSARTHR